MSSENLELNWLENVFFQNIFVKHNDSTLYIFNFVGLIPPKIDEDQKETDIKILISESENKDSCGIVSRGDSFTEGTETNLKEDLKSKERSSNYALSSLLRSSLSSRDEEENMNNAFPSSTPGHEIIKRHETRNEDEARKKQKGNKIIRCIAWATQ